jgi:hypothetical protein
MRALRSGQFWAGVIVGVLLLVVFPQLNPRSMAMGKKQ